MIFKDLNKSSSPLISPNSHDPTFSISISISMGNSKLRIIHLEASNYGDHTVSTSVVDPDPELQIRQRIRPTWKNLHNCEKFVIKSGQIPSQEYL